MNNIELLTEMFDRAARESAILPISRNFLHRYIPTLIECKKIDLILDICKNFTRDESLTFLLCVPELWKSMDISDWCMVIQSMSPRPKYSVFESVGWYSDIEFLIKWLNLDGIKLAVSMDEVNTEDKKNICNFCRACFRSLQLTQEDIEDLDGEILCSVESLERYREQLISRNHNLLPTYSNSVSFKGYVEGIWQQRFGN